jgi:hypothetical protein
MSDGPGFKQKIRDVSNTRGRLISAQKEDQELTHYFVLSQSQ